MSVLPPSFTAETERPRRLRKENPKPGRYTCKSSLVTCHSCGILPRLDHNALEAANHSFTCCCRGRLRSLAWATAGSFWRLAHPRPARGAAAVEPSYSRRGHRRCGPLRLPAHSQKTKVAGGPHGSACYFANRRSLPGWLFLEPTSPRSAAHATRGSTFLGRAKCDRPNKLLALGALAPQTNLALQGL